MAVAIDALMTAGEQTDCNETDNGTTNNGTGITVGAGATVLVATQVWGGAELISNPTASWNGVSMDLAGFQTWTGAATGGVAIFILGSPASGVQALNSGWTTTSDSYISAASFTGTSTVTADAYEPADTQLSSTGTSITVTSTTDGATVGVAERNSGEPTMTGTTIFKYGALDPGAGADYQIGGTSNTHTFTFGGGSAQAMAGIHLLAGAAGGATVGYWGRGIRYIAVKNR